jgi:hypothetical protein
LKQGAKMGKEDKKERFKRVAERRTNDILEKIRVLGNCANRGSYDFSEEEVNKIFSEIDKQLKIVKMKFLADKREKFKL